MLLLLALLLQTVDEQIESAAKEFVASLTDAQRAAVVLKYDDKRRDAEVFFPGERPGVQISALSDGSRGHIEKAMKLFLSERGWKTAGEIAAQGEGGKRSIGEYWVTFFGAPGEGAPYAWRVAEHHLTILHITVDPKSSPRFGPILLGSNPPSFFDEEEAAAAALWKAMTEEERKSARAGDTGGSGRSVRKDEGVRVGDLPEERRKLVAALLDARLGFFSDGIRSNVLKIVKDRGGVDALRLVFYGDPASRGKYDWKLGGDKLLVDFQSTHGHIHTTLRIR